MLTDQERVDLAVRVLSERERSTEPGDVELCTLARAVLTKELSTQVLAKPDPKHFCGFEDN